MLKSAGFAAAAARAGGADVGTHLSARLALLCAARTFSRRKTAGGVTLTDALGTSGGSGVCLMPAWRIRLRIEVRMRAGRYAVAARRIGLRIEIGTESDARRCQKHSAGEKP